MKAFVQSEQPVVLGLQQQQRHSRWQEQHWPSSGLSEHMKVWGPPRQTQKQRQKLECQKKAGIFKMQIT